MLPGQKCLATNLLSIRVSRPLFVMSRGTSETIGRFVPELTQAIRRQRGEALYSLTGRLNSCWSTRIVRIQPFENLDESHRLARVDGPGAASRPAMKLIRP